MLDHATPVQIGERNDHGGDPVHNRDALGHASLLAGHLLVLASGMGGTNGGRVEGNLAVSTVLTTFRTSSAEGAANRLAEALNTTDEVLRDRAAKGSALRGTGAACGAVLVESNRFFAARVGDIRVLLVRGGTIIDVLSAPVDPSGDNNEQDFSCLGGPQRIPILVTNEAIPLQPGDRLVLASPGLHEHVSPAEIGRVVTELVPQVAAGRLVDLARKNGARGGISLQVLQLGDGLSTSASGGNPLRYAELVEPTAGSTPRPASAPVRNPATDLSPRAVTPARSESVAHGIAAATPSAWPPAADFNTHGTPAAQDMKTNDWRERRPRRRNLPLGSHGDFRPKNRWLAPASVAALVLLTLWWMVPGEEGAEIVQTSVDSEQAASTSPTTKDNSPADELALIPAAIPADPAVQLALEMETDVALGNSGKTFWTQMGQALRAEAPINDALVREALDLEDSQSQEAVTEQALQRLAELHGIEQALIAASLNQDALSEYQLNRLTRIFELETDMAAEKLRRFIAAEYEKHQEKIFASVEAFVRTNRSPQTTRVLLKLVALRPGPKTRNWLKQELPDLLSGI